MKTIRVILTIGLLAAIMSCSEKEKEMETEESGDPKFNQLQYSDETQSFTFMAIGGEENVFPIMDDLTRLWGEPNIYPVQIKRSYFAEYFMADDQLPKSERRPKLAWSSYNYIYYWHDKRFPYYSEVNNSISIEISPAVVSSPLWENLYPEDWDSVLSLRAIEVTRVNLRISHDEVNPQNLSLSEKDIVKKFIQPLINKKLGPSTEFIPPEQHFTDFLELAKRKREIQKRFPPEMQEGYFPVIGLPRDRNEIDLRLSYSYPIAKPIKYKIQIIDSLNKEMDHQLYVSNKLEIKELNEIVIPESDSNYTTIDTYVYHIRIDRPERVQKIILQNNNEEKFLLYQAGDETSSGFLMLDVSLISEEK